MTVMRAHKKTFVMLGVVSLGKIRVVMTTTPVQWTHAMR